MGRILVPSLGYPIVAFCATMLISFKTRKLEKVFNSRSTLKKTYSDKLARAIMIRLAVLKNARTLANVSVSPPERRHLLTGGRKGQYAVDLDQSLRLVFEPNHQPLPRSGDGGIDLKGVTAITINEVIDYH